MYTKANYIIKTLLKNKFQAYFVGGYVRDHILGIKSEDIDLVTNAKPDDLFRIFNNHKIKKVGESFGVILIDDIEVATYRKDNYFGLNDKNVEITYADTLQEDLQRRDFTINSLAMDYYGHIIDYCNGINDVNERIIKFVGSPEKRIIEDPNRIIRACRFVAKLNGFFEYNTFLKLKEYSKIAKNIAKERIRLEIMKSMKIEKSSIFFKSLYDIDLLKIIFYHLNKCYGMEHGKYHKESIFEHSMICGDSISSKNPLLKLTGYLHDCGKSISFQGNGDQRSFINHELVGSDVLKDELKKLTFSNDEINYITNFTKIHMRGLKQSSPKAVRKLLKKLDEYKISYKDLLKFKIADRKANLMKNNYSYNDIKGFLIKYNIELNREEQQSFMKLSITGNDIMKLTNLDPGPKVGKIKKYLEEYILEYPEKNNKEDLFKIIYENIFYIY